MVVFALLTAGAVLAAAGAGLYILKKEYLPLLRALEQCQSCGSTAPDDPQFGEGDGPWI